MKKIGIVGGLGPEATVDYYRGIIDAFKPTYEEVGYPEIAIESLDLRSMVAAAGAGEWDWIASMVADRFETLRLSGAEIGAMTANTPHKVFDEIQQGTSLPLISIVEATRDHALGLRVQKLGLLGTKFTMESDFYPRAFTGAGIELAVPGREEIDYIQKKLFTEIEFGIIKESTKKGLLSIIDKMEGDESIEGVILGCTELPLILKPDDLRLHYIDTTAIHIAKIVDRCRDE